MNQPTKYCHACAKAIDARAEICPACGVRQPGHAPVHTGASHPSSGLKLAAGLCGILVGAFGVHKFVLGYTRAGVIMAAVTVLTCGFGAFATGIIGIIEGIIYLTKSDEEFHEIYVAGKKEWF